MASKTPIRQLHVPIGWQDRIFAAIRDANPELIRLSLEQSPVPALDSQIHRRVLGGHLIFVFHERLYTAHARALRSTLGSSFEFEEEGQRAEIAAWLTMVGAKEGDTLLHIVMRLNGIDDTSKAKCAVEILGRGASFEIENCDGELCSQVDEAFKLAWLKELKAWRQQREDDERLQLQQRKQEARKAAEAKRRKAAAQEVEAQRANVEEARQRELREMEEAQKRLTFHKALDRMLVKLDRREQQQEKHWQQQAWRELMTDVRHTFDTWFCRR